MASPRNRSLEDRLARLQSLSEYKSGRRRKIILNNAAEVKLAQNILAELDTDKSGEISLAEIEAAEKRCREFAERSCVKEQQWHVIFNLARELCWDGVLSLDDLKDCFGSRKSWWSHVDGLVHNQRAMRKFVLVLVFISCGVTVFSTQNTYASGPLEGQHWTVMDSLYFAVVTLTTVGFGDFYPITKPMKLVTVFYVVVGIVFVGEIMLEFSRTCINASFEFCLERAGRKPDMRLRLYIIVALFTLTIVVGTIGVSIIEGWDFVDSFYWAVITVTTVGYGDQTLFRPESRAFAAVFVVLSFMVVGATLGQVGAVLVDLEVQRREQEMMAQKLSPQLLARMDFDGNGVTEGEFLCFALLELGKATEQDLRSLILKFYEADRSGDGILSSADLVLMDTEVIRSQYSLDAAFVAQKKTKHIVHGEEWAEATFHIPPALVHAQLNDEEMKELTDLRELIKEVKSAAKRARLRQELHQDPERALLARLCLQQQESINLLAGRAFGLHEPLTPPVPHSMPMRPGQRLSEIDLDLIDREPPLTSRSLADSLASSKNSRLEFGSMVERGEAAFIRVAGVPHPQHQGAEPSHPQTVESPPKRGFVFTRAETLRLPPEHDGSPAASPARPEENLRVIEEGLRAISRDGPERSSNKNLDVLLNRIEALNSALSKPAPSYVRGG